jgi:hypothetical protein
LRASLTTDAPPQWAHHLGDRQCALTVRSSGLTFTAQDFFRPVEEVIAELGRMGVTMTNLRDIARELGVELSENPTIAELQNLQTRLREFDFKAFTNSFEGFLKQFQIGLEVFGEGTAASRAKGFRDVLTSEVGAPIFDALKEFDLDTAEGRQAAREFVQSIFTQLIAGDFDPEEFLGGLSLDQILQAIPQFIGFLNDATRERSRGSAGRADAKAARRKPLEEAGGLSDFFDETDVSDSAGGPGRWLVSPGSRS